MRFRDLIRRPGWSFLNLLHHKARNHFKVPDILSDYIEPVVQRRDPD